MIVGELTSNLSIIECSRTGVVCHRLSQHRRELVGQHTGMLGQFIVDNFQEI